MNRTCHDLFSPFNMPLFYQSGSRDIQIYVWKLEESVDELCKISGISRSEVDLRFNHSSRCCEWLAVRALIRTVLGPDVLVAYRATGEPYLQGSSLRVSISHTRGYVAVAFHPTCHVGVDIEYFSHRIDKLVGRIMSCGEKPSCELGADDKTWYYLLVWSMKESVFKALDISLLDYQTGIRVSPFMLGRSGEASVTYSYLNWHYPVDLHYLRTDDFVLTWCCERSFSLPPSVRSRRFRPILPD